MSAPEADAARTLAVEGPAPVGARRHWPGRDARPEDLIICLLCLLVAAVAAGESLPRYFGRQGIGPGAFPTWVATLLVCCGVIILVKVARQRGLAAWEDWPRGPALRRVLLASASMVVYLAVLQIIGFWLASSLLLLFHLRVLGHYSWRVAVPTAFISALLIAYIFGVLLFMPLPPGFVGI
jgi:putative tricarboxylic transport membrane protein